MTKTTGYILAVGVFFALIMTALFGENGLSLLGEGGILENTQVTILGLTAFILVKSALDLRQGKGITNNEGLAYILVFLCIPILGFSRELSFGKVLALHPQIVVSLKIIIGGLAFVSLAMAIRMWLGMRPKRLKMLKGYTTNIYSFCIYAALLIFAFGSLFEKGKLGMPKSEMVEEVMELLAFIVLLGTAVRLKIRNGLPKL